MNFPLMWNGLLADLGQMVRRRLTIFGRRCKKV